MSSRPLEALSHDPQRGIINGLDRPLQKLWLVKFPPELRKVLFSNDSSSSSSSSSSFGARIGKVSILTDDRVVVELDSPPRGVAKAWHLNTSLLPAERSFALEGQGPGDVTSHPLELQGNLALRADFQAFESAEGLASEAQVDPPSLDTQPASAGRDSLRRSGSMPQIVAPVYQTEVDADVLRLSGSRASLAERNHYARLSNCGRLVPKPKRTLTQLADGFDPTQVRHPLPPKPKPVKPSKPQSSTTAGEADKAQMPLIDRIFHCFSIQPRWKIGALQREVGEKYPTNVKKILQEIAEQLDEVGTKRQWVLKSVCGL